MAGHLNIQTETGHLTYTPVLPPNLSLNEPGGQIDPTTPIILLPQTFSLWIMSLKQNNQLEGPRAQSRLTRHFYPRSYGPGELIVSGRAASQKNLQDLAIFIRGHQSSIVNGGVQIDKKMMTLVIPTEGIFLQGFIPRFNLIKRGVFAPIPEYTFNFVITYDPNHTSQSLVISHIVKKWFTGSPSDIQPFKAIPPDLSRIQAP